MAGLDPADIDLILVGTCTPDYWMPATAVLVKEAIGDDARRGDGPLGGLLRLRLRLLGRPRLHRQRAVPHVLVIGAEVLTRFLDYPDRNTCVLFGDGAGAVVLSASDEPGGGLLGFELTADPEGAYKIWTAGRRHGPADRPGEPRAGRSATCAWRARRRTATRRGRWRARC